MREWTQTRLNEAELQQLADTRRERQEYADRNNNHRPQTQMDDPSARKSNIHGTELYKKTSQMAGSTTAVTPTERKH